MARVVEQRLSVMQDVPDVLFRHAQPLGSLVDGQAFADDEADRRPVQRRLAPCILDRLHDLEQVRTRLRTFDPMVRGAAGKIKAHMYLREPRTRARPGGNT